MLIAVYILVGLALLMIAWGASGAFKKPSLGLPQAARGQGVKLHSFLGKIFPFTRALLEKTRLDAKIKAKLDAAHLRMTAVEFFNLKLLVVAGLLAGSFVLAGKFEPVLGLAFAGLGYIIPDFMLKKRIARRKYMIARTLPETVDLLGLCIEAGLDFTSAVKWVMDKVPSSPMMEEMSLVLEEIRWGKPRIQALKDMSRRLDIPEVSSFVQTIIQAERMGTPVAEAFTILSEDARGQRFHRGERIALQAPIKILLPLIFCIMPVIGIVIGGPILLQFMSGGLTAGIK